MYIYREIEALIHRRTKDKKNFGFIVSGIVGCGKTTAIRKILTDLKNEFQIFEFSGDDIHFRKVISENTKYLSQYVESQTNKRSVVFIDEVQKCEEVFDAVKYAFDTGKISFIVSGSNPAFLSTVAKKRLQRRADQINMLPLSLPEILNSKKHISENWINLFKELLFNDSKPENLKIPEMTMSKEISDEVSLFLNYGGLPLSYTMKDEASKLSEIRLSTERGFDLISVGNDSVSESIKLEIADLNSKEFTYQNILNKTRLRKRDDINLVIDNLINHGYFVSKKHVLLKNNKSTYLTVFSYIDCGILTYLRGSPPRNEDKGYWLEGYIHTRLNYHVQHHFFKTTLGYYKPHTVDVNKKIKYLPGEIDFIVQLGQKIIPIEVKLTEQKSHIDTTLIKKIITQDYKSRVRFGIVIYGGVAHYDSKNKILYWPYWLV